MLLVLLGCMLSLGGAASAKEVITGLRTWKFTDGSELRAGLRTAKDGKAVLTTSHRNPPIPFEKFIPEHRKILEAIVSGEVELLEDPRSGVGNYISVKTEAPDQVLRLAVIGRERIWTRKDGKTAKGSLLNITDDEIHLLIADSIWKMRVADMTVADLDYLEGINRGTEQAIPARLDVPGFLPVPGDKPGHIRLSVDGARFMDSKPVISFEDALARAKAEISSKMAATAWSLHQVQEKKVVAIAYQEKRIAGCPPGKWRSCYQITFTIAERKIAEARRAFPANADVSGTCYFVYFDDGLPLDQKFIPAETK